MTIVPRAHHLAYPLAACLIGVLGCSGSKGPSISLRLAGGSGGGGDRCAVATARDGEPLSTAVSKVRVTLRSRDAEGKTIDFCDRVFDFPGEPPFLRLPAKDGKSIDIYAETFGPAGAMDPRSAGGFQRLHTGSLLGVDPAAQTLSALRLYATAGSRCAGARMRLARAFHTATVLPDGRVLFVGGLVASTSEEGNIAFDLANGAPATGGAEIYDPRDQSITPVTESTAPLARAFHAAQLLDGIGPCASGQLGILLVGGVTAAAGDRVLNVSRGIPGGRLVPFYPMGLFTAPLMTRAAGNEVLCLDPLAHSATRKILTGSSAAAFRAAGLGPSGLIAAGGIDYDASMGNATVSVTEIGLYPASGATPVVQMIGTPRSGATLTQLDAVSALVWGGAISPGSIGDLVTQVGGALGSTPLTVAGTAYTEFHTATLLDGGSSLLVTGGFETTAGGVNIQPPATASAVRRLSLSSGVVSAQNITGGGTYGASPNCTDPGRYRPAGWESAIPISRGRVLVSGGSPSTDSTAPRCLDCPDDPTSLLCAIGQASIYTSATEAFLPAPEPLQVARMGHVSTLLGDGTVLLSGGIGSEPGAGSKAVTVFIADLEVYNPRDLVPPYDVMKGGVDPDDPIAGLLQDADYQRAPGHEAASATAPDQPIRRCGSL